MAKTVFRPTEVKKTPDENLGNNSGKIKGMAESLIEAVSK